MSPTSPEANRWFVLFLVCLAQFMVVLDATIVNVALPSIQEDLGFTPEDLPWVINSYTLCFGGFLLLGGRAADLFGRRRLFLLGVAVFTGASVLDGLSTSPAMLVGARALQGLGAALVSPAALSIVTTTFTDPVERAKALGVWATAGGGGGVGLVAGGVLTDALSWEWIFFVNIPIGVAAFVLAARYITESRRSTRHGAFDLGGAVLVTAGLVLLTYGIVKAQSFGWGDARTLGLLAGAGVLLCGFVVLEGRHPAPLVRLDVFRIRSITVSNITMLLLLGALYGFFYLGTLYLQQIRDFTALETGLGFLPMTGGIVFGSWLAQGLIRRLGIKSVLVGALAVVALGLLWLTGLDTGSSYVGGFLPGLVLIAVGLGVSFVPLTLAATSIEDERAGLASGVLNTSQQVGGALGIAVLSTIAAGAAGGSGAAAVVHGYTVAFTVGMALVLAGMVLTITLLRRADVAGAEAAAAEPALASV